MIQQVLNKQLLVDLLEDMDEVANVDANTTRRATTGTGMDEMSPAEKEELAADVAATRTDRELGPPATPGRRGGPAEVSLADRNTFIPRSAALSNLQSAIEEYFQTQRPDVVEGPQADQRRGGAATVAGSQLTIWPDYLEGRRLFGRFEQTDVRWINSLFAKGMRKFRGKHPFIARPARKEPITFPDDKVRMIVFGDWGSGIPRAHEVSKRIRQELKDGVQQGLQQHVIHLGDVYYSGWESEYRDRFLNDWPVSDDQKDSIGSYTLNGNHDMYSGGHAYYEYALADKRFAPWQGKSSLFYLKNSYWQLFGLDTSHDDAGLKGDQADWVRGAAQKGLKTMLLSHHQYSSSYEEVSQTVVDKIQPVLKELDVAAWLWGHEHRCMTYKGVPGIRFPRCLGHGGVPVYQTHDKGGPTPSPGDWEYREFLDGGVELWAKFGYVVLDFHRDKIDVRYMNEDSDQPDKSETIQ